MAINFMNMPAAQYPRSALLDFAPLAQSLQNYNAGSDQAQQHRNMTQIGQTAASQGYGAAGKQAMGLGEVDAGMELNKQGDAQRDRFVKRYGVLAQQTDLEADPNKRARMWSGTLERMRREGAQYGINGEFDPDEMDPMTGPKLFMAQAGIVSDPLERELMQTKLSAMQEEQAAARAAREREAQFYNQFSQPTPTAQPQAPQPVPTEGAGRFAQPQMAPPQASGPMTPRQLFDKLPPERQAAAQSALQTGDRATFLKILQEKPEALADNLSPGEKRVDQAFAKSYEDFVLSGGAADYDKNLEQLKGVHKEIANPQGANYSGPVLGRMPDAITSYTNPKAVDLRQQVEEIVQRNLRIVLGAQFTQKEGENLIARAYNPALDEATNAKRLERLISSMEKMKAAKMKAMDYFEKNGTMKGFRGTTQFSVNDILADVEAGPSTSQPQQRPDPLGLFGGN